MGKGILLLGIKAIKKILWTCAWVGFQLVVLARRDVLCEAAAGADFHAGWNVTYPHMVARFSFIKVFCDLEPLAFHEICQKKPGNALHHPGVFFEISITDSDFADFGHGSIIMKRDRDGVCPYLISITMESGPTKCSTRISRKPASLSQAVQSVPV